MIWIKGKTCYRCSNTGLIQVLLIKEGIDGKKYLQTTMMKCDCPKADKRFKDMALYSDKFGDGHQFYYTEELMRSTDPPLTYAEVFYIYHNYIKRELERTGRAEIPVDGTILMEYLNRHKGRIKKQINESKVIRQWWL